MGYANVGYTPGQSRRELTNLKSQSDMLPVVRKGGMFELNRRSQKSFEVTHAFSGEASMKVVFNYCANAATHQPWNHKLTNSLSSCCLSQRLWSIMSTAHHKALL